MSAAASRRDAQNALKTASPLSFTVNAEGAIFGNDFSIGSLGGSLDMAFNANASGGDGAIFFSDATLSSNGGNIAMYGDSDPVNGRAGLGKQAACLPGQC